MTLFTPLLNESYALVILPYCCDLLSLICVHALSRTCFTLVEFDVQNISLRSLAVGLEERVPSALGTCSYCSATPLSPWDPHVPHRVVQCNASRIRCDSSFFRTHVLHLGNAVLAGRMNPPA